MYSCGQSSEILFSPWCEHRVAAEPRKSSGGCAQHFRLSLQCALCPQCIWIRAYFCALYELHLWFYDQEKLSVNHTEQENMFHLAKHILLHPSCILFILVGRFTFLWSIHGCYCCRHTSVLAASYTSSDLDAKDVYWSRQSCKLNFEFQVQQMYFCTVASSNIARAQQPLCGFVAFCLPRVKWWELALLARRSGAQALSMRLALQDRKEVQLFCFLSRWAREGRRIAALV